MKIELILFTVSAFYFWVCWIGFLFALKPFDFYAKQCKNAAAGNVAFTLLSTLWVVLLLFNPPDNDLTMSLCTLFSVLCVFAAFCSYIGKVCSMVSNFHRKQKDKRV